MISLQMKVALLSGAAAYGDAGGHMEAIETHMSWVFLTRDRAYKLKKPVRFPYLDFSTLALREVNCRAELTLNRRLAPGVYLRVTPLTFDEQDGLKLDGEGDVVDWLVVMRRLPADRMLDELIAKGPLAASDCERLACKLASFYRDADRLSLSPPEYFRRLEAEQAENRIILTSRDFAVDHARAPVVLERMERWLATERPSLEARAAEGFLVDGHGDLRPQHICFENGLEIIDCLEFSATLRQVDPVDELAALSVECALLGATTFGLALFTRVMDAGGAPRPERLFHLHSGRRAILRARLALSHLLDPVPRQPERWEPLATHYLKLAEKALDKLDVG
jgi:aminoglycoside phosphotransferase family enzyme